MSDPTRSTSPSRSASLRAPKDESERVVEENRSAGGSDGAARSRAGADAPIFAPASEPLGGIDIENEAPSSHPPQTNNPPISGPPQQARKETLLGIPKPSASAPANFNPNYDDDYDKHLPPDPIYEEATSPNARVYRVYMAESAKYDAYMTDEARDGLDVLLVFAGLFSSVLTTFVAQTSQNLQPDRATESTLLLREITSLQLFTPSAIDVWVNGLWFTSLTLSLISALLAVLIKQWIRHYTSFVSGTAKERSLIRQYRFMGLQKWHVPMLIGILPVLMHLSLAIFLVGLTLFLLPLHRSIASIVGSLSALVFIVYVTTATWPLIHIQCPYHTPLTNIIHDITFTLRKYMLRSRPGYASLKEQEFIAACKPGEYNDALVAHAFKWLISMSSNPSVHRVVVQAVAGVRRKSSLIENLVGLDVTFLLTWNRMLADSICQSPDGVCFHPEKVDLLERLFRSALQIRDSPSLMLMFVYRWDAHTLMQPSQHRLCNGSQRQPRFYGVMASARRRVTLRTPCSLRRPAQWYIVSRWSHAMMKHNYQLLCGRISLQQPRHAPAYRFLMCRLRS
ncbi:hypothetical protein BDZ89DRAFT_1081077 [Hymenopellis radicata]|nr:hypothetical protein BDZ89DRAFT_1081077 [Hymenopellis radicata]